jgi:alpha-L-fucosidase
MKKLLAILLISIITLQAQDFTKETVQQHNARMNWWRDARFGLFIHWGLYSVPAGQWGENTTYGEWIRDQAQIPVEEYDKLLTKFDPVKFNANEWVRMAKDAGMKYIVITSKHHDGFCLFDSKYTDFDVMSTPFKRDIMKELAAACRKHGMKICWYHSIMDWHHPDYLPRRGWEKTRTTEGADFERYVQHLKNQLKEIVTNYGDISVLWFDGEWESTWSDPRGKDLYNYIRSLSPNIIINNRVSSSRSGLEGFTAAGGFAGDFGTPEQQVPATGLPDVDWESCITMNDHWGYNKNDFNWKSTKDLIQMLTDVASKGGNLLLNVGPTAEGLFPQASINRLKEISKWMKVNCESIYGTTAGPFKQLDWGRCTQKKINNNTRLYLHVFNWPQNGKLVLPGIYNKPLRAYLLADKSKKLLSAQRNEDAVVVNVPLTAPDEYNSVVVLDVEGKADVNNPPAITSKLDSFINEASVEIKTDREKTEIRYTLDGTVPVNSSTLYKDKITITNTTTVSARIFREGKPVSGIAQRIFTKVNPEKSLEIQKAANGIKCKYFEGEWDKLPDFDKLTQLNEATLSNFNLNLSKKETNTGFEFTGLIKIPAEDIYQFFTDSDDGSKLYIDNRQVVDNDGPHSMTQKSGVIALAPGYHSLRVTFFQKTGGAGLKVYISGGEMEKQEIPESMLFVQ